MSIRGLIFIPSVYEIFLLNMFVVFLCHREAVHMRACFPVYLEQVINPSRMFNFVKRGLEPLGAGDKDSSI